MSAGVTASQEALIGIQQVKNQYKSVSRSIFDKSFLQSRNFKAEFEKSKTVFNQKDPAKGMLRDILTGRLDKLADGTENPMGLSEDALIPYNKFIIENRKNLELDIDTALDFLYQ